MVGAPHEPGAPGPGRHPVFEPSGVSPRRAWLQLVRRRRRAQHGGWDRSCLRAGELGAAPAHPRRSPCRGPEHSRRGCRRPTGHRRYATTRFGRPVEAFCDNAAPIAAGDIKPSDTLAILYTSGTTGPSRASAVRTPALLVGRTPPASSICAMTTRFTTLPLSPKRAQHLPAPMEQPRCRAAFRRPLRRNGAHPPPSHICRAPWCHPCGRNRLLTPNTGTLCEWRGPGVLAELKPGSRRTASSDDGYGRQNNRDRRSHRRPRPGKMAHWLRLRGAVVDAQDTRCRRERRARLALRADEPFALATAISACRTRRWDISNLWFPGDRGDGC
jgi:hypothetical protein